MFDFTAIDSAAAEALEEYQEIKDTATAQEIEAWAQKWYKQATYKQIAHILVHGEIIEHRK